MFYAHLYIGLHYEAAGDAEKAKQNIAAAAALNKPTAGVNRYMQDVARIHNLR